MLLAIKNILSPKQVQEAQNELKKAEWVDGKITAGHQSATQKYNKQLPENHPSAQKVGSQILKALEQNPLFISAALPLKVFPPLFNRYEGGEHFGVHIDNAIRQVPGTPYSVRTDLSATLFLSDPAEYDGGELCIDDNFGIQSVKLSAGSLILYPASSLHQVKPVTRGSRLCSFFWIQSMVREDSLRTILFDLDTAIQKLNQESESDKAVNQAVNQATAVTSLTGVYHNLLRRFAET